MTDLLVFLLTAWGAIYVLTESAIFAPVRIFLSARSIFLQTLLSCAYCTGFWVGMLLDIAMTRGFDAADHLLAGLLTIGSVAAVRVLQPTFLPGPPDYEREITDEERQRRADG